MPLKIQVWILQDSCILSTKGEMYKCYVLLFTCCVTRAVHLELTTDVNSNSVILALRRFISRRGILHLFISDNFKTTSGDPDGHVGGVWTLAFNAVLYRDWLKTRVLCYDLIF